MILALPFIPLVAALAVLALPSSRLREIKVAALLGAGLPFAIVLFYFAQFLGTAGSGFRFVQRFDWIPSLGIHYAVGLDGINLTLCLLHGLVSFAGAFVSLAPKERLKEYVFYYLVLIGPIYGVFTSLDLFFLYLFYEFTLIPLYPMIGIWGSKNKEYGAMKLTIFITAGAVLTLFGILLLYRETGYQTFDLLEMTRRFSVQPPGTHLQKTVAALFLIGFGVIASLWPLHSWSPIGYAAAPTSVSMVHAGVLKKMGPYLILRLAVGLLPQGTAAWSGWLALLAGIGILYAGYAAITQKDLKFMVGFSSVSHMGYVLLGIAAMNVTSLSGTVLLMFSHGVMAACTFALIGFLYEQAHVRGIEDFGGLAKAAPFFGVTFIMASMASLGLPGFSNFASELLIFIGSWQKYPLLVAGAVFGVLITALYLLRTVQQVCYGPVSERSAHLRDAKTFSERFPVLLLLGALLVFGIWPQGLLRIIQPAVEALLP